MSGEETRSITGLIRILLQGKQRNAENPQDVRISGDRELVILSKLAGNDGARGERVITLDPNGIIRFRPYESLHPIDGVVLTSALATIYTSTDAESRVFVDVVNTLGAAATCRVRRFVNSGSGGFDILAAGTPVPQGVGIRVGPFDLLDTGFIRGSSSPGNSCTMHLTIDRYNATGDTP